MGPTFSPTNLPRSSALGPDFDAPGSIGAAVDGGDGLHGSDPEAPAPALH